MRYSDIIKLTKENIVGNSIVYVSQKTKIKAEIPLSGVAYRFIDDLEFVNRTICKNTANSTIRRICKNCGIDQNIKLSDTGQTKRERSGISSHFISARRSFATNLYLRGTDLYSISKLMGHADIQMTVHYIVCPPRISDKAL